MMSIIDRELTPRERSEFGLSVTVFGGLAMALLLVLPALAG